VLSVIAREVRDPGPGKVRIAVRAAAVNPTDITLREQGIDGDAPWVPGMDAAGTVESVGDGVDRFEVGDAVMAAVRPIGPDGGAQAELVVVPAASVVQMPDGATFEEAATLPMNGLTAMLGFELLDLPEGASLAVSGGAGYLASYVIPLAKRRGLRVLADAKPEDEFLVRGFGADVVLARGETFIGSVLEEIPGGVDGFFDTALLMQDALPAIRDGGAIAAVRPWTGGEPERGIVVRRVGVRSVFDRTAWLEELRRHAGDGLLALRVAATFPPDQVVEAQRLTSAGGIRGRAVIVFD
jgi:NADPH:quinone reductase-like Zn-dependent oxidoreductase